MRTSRPFNQLLIFRHSSIVRITALCHTISPVPPQVRWTSTWPFVTPGWLCSRGRRSLSRSVTSDRSTNSRSSPFTISTGTSVRSTRDSSRGMSSCSSLGQWRWGRGLEQAWGWEYSIQVFDCFVLFGFIRKAVTLVVELCDR